MKHPPAVIIPADRPGTLGIARSLGRRGIPVHGVDVDPNAIGMASKYLRPHPLPNSDDSDENRLLHLIDLGKRLGEKAVLYPVSDDDVLLCSRERRVLEEYYLFVMPEHDTVADLVSKDGLYRVAQRCQVNTPEVFQPRDEADLEALSEVLAYPVILKPMFSTSWLNPEIVSMLRDSPLSNPPKVALCQDAESLIHTYRKIAAYDPNMVIQEVIGGEDERLAYCCFYLDRESRPLAIFSGRKLRILPVGFGSATYVRSVHDRELEEVSLRLLEGVRYQGLGGVEFKKDPRDEQYKLIEFNARFGLWDTLSIRCGIDIPYIAYCDALDQPVQAQFEYREEIGWVDMQRDVRAFLIYRQRQQLRLGDWLRTLQGEKEWSTYARDDWKPAAVEMLKLFERPWSSIKQRIPGAVRAESEI
jgi:predicted ATP-grasp superfamily ATP-dependent carboligase